MPGKDLFEYAVIRVVPKVEREEFLNVGVIVYCAKQKFLQTKCNVDKERLCSFSEKTDIEMLKEYLNGFDQVCKGSIEAGEIGKLPIAERFRWLTATRSTVVQTSKVHPGLCDDARNMLDRLFEELVV
jgi:hypothetical protein